ncbi:MAG: methyl-accepting chemotaxis protein [Ignavibacteriae bacterium]|nr:methyl-accepting chemotaxis protein [Ignavibacteriota bacterium]
MLNHSSVQMKLFIPVAIVLTAVVFTAALLTASMLSDSAMHEFREQLTTLAVTSRAMIHSSAEELVKSKGYAFHRHSDLSANSSDKHHQLYQEVIRSFEANPRQEVVVKEGEEDGVPHMFAFAAAKVQDECRMCHNPGGVDLFPDKKNGDIVGVFGVSGSTEPVMASARTIRWTILGLGALAVVLIGAAFTFFTERIVNKPLKKILKSSVAVAAGDLTVSLPVNGNDEIAQLGMAFNKMVSDMSGALRDVTKAMDATAASAQGISATADQMAAGAQEQSSQAGEVAAAVEEMTKTIGENSRNASLAAQTAQHSQRQAAEGGETMHETIDAVKQIGSAVDRFSATIKSLGASSNQIGEIISVIDDIADQTNLLALNAAIEAARAGEQGRGFAVVADEVRKLAERTMKATKEIAGMIRQIQSDTSVAVTSLKEGTTAVERGIDRAGQAGVLLEGIVKVSKEVLDVVALIAGASEEQAATSEQIARNVDSINTVTHQNAVGLQQMAQSVETLNGQSATVEQLLHKFKLADEDSAHAYPDETPRRFATEPTFRFHQPQEKDDFAHAS